MEGEEVVADDDKAHSGSPDDTAHSGSPDDKVQAHDLAFSREGAGMTASPELPTRSSQPTRRRRLRGRDAANWRRQGYGGCGLPRGPRNAGVGAPVPGGHTVSTNPGWFPGRPVTRDPNDGPRGQGEADEAPQQPRPDYDLDTDECRV